MPQKILLAYSGGLDTSAIIPWLKETYNADIYAYCCDVGNLPDEKILKERALRLGAKEFFFEDKRDDFVQDYVYPMARAGATYQDDYLLGTAIARPLQAARVAAVAKDLGVFAIAHGATGKGNDQLRFEKAWAYLAPEIKVIAPWKEWDFKGRQQLVQYLKSHAYEYQGEIDPKYSVDANLFHRSCEGGILEDIGMPFDKEEVLELICPPSKTDAKASVVITLGFEKGFAVSLNGVPLTPRKILETLNDLGSAQGIGIVDLVEERMNGIKSRGIYETPGGTILYAATKAIKQICWNRDLASLASSLADKYGAFIYDGLWHTDARLSLEAFFNQASTNLCGEIVLELVGGHIFVMKRQSPYSLYNQALVSFEEDTFDLNSAAKGHCHIEKYSHWLAGKVMAK